LTSDVETGAGAWTDDMIGRAIREGIGHDGRMLHPQMWYGAFHDLSDEDVASVVVYVRSLPAVRNALPQTRIPFGRRINYADLPQPITAPVPQPDLSTEVKSGEYLANVADCAGCHTSWYHPDAPIFTKLFGGGNAIDLNYSVAGTRSICRTEQLSSVRISRQTRAGLATTTRTCLLRPCAPATSRRGC
jgi:mono/diheme cytochrome c family protein